MAGLGERATSFGAAAAAYAAGRPEYQAGHVAWLLDGVRGPVLDLGAGTGKLTSMIAALGFEVIAIDPDPQMLALNTAGDTRVGSAESIPLPDASASTIP